MNLYDCIFYFFAAVTVLSACVVAFSRNIVYSAFALLFTFFGVAGIYVLLNADFLAVTQLLVYVGGILVLILFGVMLTNRVVSVDIKTGSMSRIPAILICSALAGILVSVFTMTEWRVVNPTVIPGSTAGAIGGLLMTAYLLPFEIASVLLLVALIGAAFLARKDVTR